MFCFLAKESEFLEEDSALISREEQHNELLKVLESVGETALAAAGTVDSALINSSFDSIKNFANGNSPPPVPTTNSLLIQHQSFSFAGSVLRNAFKHISTDSYMGSSIEKVFL